MPNDPNKYDVFLSFRGRDTRCTFTGNLCNALRRNRIKTFSQDVNLLESGDQIPPSTLKAIQESRISMVVLSENYASSSRCLNELVAILDCMKTNNQLVWPIFYGVDPSVVRRHRGSYGKALSTLEKRFRRYKEKLKQWKEALTEITNLTGWHYRTGCEYEFEFIRKIVESALQSLPEYNVYLSFSGEDTRYSFTSFLYNAFRREGFRIFMDDEELEGGDQIKQNLMGAIEKSRLSIVVLSENYAYYTWSLEELAKIMECKKINNQMVWPIFYKVDPSDVRYQKNSYHRAMIAHERFGKDPEKVQEWRTALFEIANLAGWHFYGQEYEYKLIERIVEKAINIENH